MNAEMDLRPSPIAGQWYPDDPARLASSVDRYLQAASLPPLPGEIVGVIAPHAGHRYSGPVAGYAFAALSGLRPELVVVAAPMHYPSYQPLLTSAHAAYATPLGPVPVDREAQAALDSALQESLGIGLVPVRNDQEHALEIELPFLQRALAGEFRLLPIMVHSVDPHLSRRLGEALAGLLAGRQTLLVASSDLSHFYPQAMAEALDSEVLKRVEALDPEGLLRLEAEGRGFACGRGAVAAVLWAALGLGANQARILHYATSGAVTGDYAQVVGYAAAAITRPHEGKP